MIEIILLKRSLEFNNISINMNELVSLIISVIKSLMIIITRGPILIIIKNLMLVIRMNTQINESIPHLAQVIRKHDYKDDEDYKL
jgi:hypothetical protein